MKKEVERVVIKSYNKAIEDYERKLLDDLATAKDSETYLAITEITESLKQKL